MRPTLPLALLTTAAIALLILGCRRAKYTPPESPLPPNTLLLSQMMRELSARPGFTEALLKQFNAPGKKGPALMTPTLIDELRRRVLGKNWSGLDRFPGWSMRRLNPTVRAIDHFAHNDDERKAAPELDLGPYALDMAQTISLDKPSPFPTSGATEVGLVTELGDGVTRGDGPNTLAPEHADSQRLADILNRLAANSLGNTPPFTVVANRVPHLRDGAIVAKVGDAGNKAAATPQQLIELLATTGHTVTVDDARYFANFGHFHYKNSSDPGAPAQDVMMPFWIDTGLDLPNTQSLLHPARPLLIPVSHAELEWHIRGPLLNADVSYYFGVDGKSEWRTMDTLDQSWVLRRAAHTYTGTQAVEATRLAGLLTVAYMHQHAARPTLPFGGYYALGVCQDGVSAIEHALTGHVTLFPNTVDATLFNDPRDAEINTLLHTIPHDRDGRAPTPDRIFGSLPTGPGPNHDFPAITIPGLREDLTAAYAARLQGKLHRRYPWPLSLFAGK